MLLQAAESRTSASELLAVTVKRFGFKKLSRDQETLITASIAGRDVFGVLPTGSGKSACYQIPGIVAGAKTLVISPLIALQDDQVKILRNLGVHAYAYHSNMEQSKRDAAYFHFRTAPEGTPIFLFVSPELLLTQTFHHRFDGMKIDRIAIDEAHCVSTWGNSFRPDYQRIDLARRRMRIPHRSAFTATSDRRTDKDIEKYIFPGSSFLKVEADPNRPNLLINVERISKEGEKAQERNQRKRLRLLELLSADKYLGAAIVYCSSKPGSADLYMKLRKMRAFQKRYGHSVHLYHADLPYEDKEATLRAFKERERPIVIATTAFGMGVDRSDVRQIIHYQTPYTLMDFAQQIGRGGRDGKETLCTTFHSAEDTLRREVGRIKIGTPSVDFVARIHELLLKRVEKLDSSKRREYNIQSFSNRLEYMARENENVKNYDAYIARVATSISLLRKVGLIIEDAKGLSVKRLLPGGAAHVGLITATQMHLRRELREHDRLTQYFSSAKPDQKLLWSMLKST